MAISMTAANVINIDKGLLKATTGSYFRKEYIRSILFVYKSYELEL